MADGEVVPRDVLLVGVAGGSGSGKTTICQRISRELGQHAGVISCDSYYHCQSHLSPEERECVNYDHPDTIDFALLAVHLQQLKFGKNVSVRQYDFATHTRSDTGQEFVPGAVVLVEGILLFADQSLHSLFDLRVFVDADAETRLQRRIKRDVQERGRTESSVRSQWEETVEPMYRAFVAPTQMGCDITIQTDVDGPSGMTTTVEAIRQMLANM